jgi:signal transduction histidine kinase
MGTANISSALISDDLIRQKLSSIFVDSIVVDQRFDVIVMSQNVLDFLEFNDEEVKKKNINYFAGTVDVSSCLRNQIAAGYFEERQISLFSKGNRCIHVGISGFYLGLISDINGYIILKVRNLDEVELIQQQLKKKTAELDKFIYSAAHDLRGPLATMKGLLNLLKMRSDNEEVDRFVSLLDAHANKLDERLFRLVYLAQADQNNDTTHNAIDFSDLETCLRKIIEQNAFVDFLEIHFESPSYKPEGINYELLSALLNNTLLYLLALKMKTTQVRVSFTMAIEHPHLYITVNANGFETSQQIREVIQYGEFAYTDMIQYPQLVNFYSAQKIAWQLDSKMRIQFLGVDEQQISFLVPMQTKTGV